MKKSIKNFVSVIFKIMIILVSSAAGLILIAICDDLGWIHTSVEDNHILAIIIWISIVSVAIYFIINSIASWLKSLIEKDCLTKANRTLKNCDKDGVIYAGRELPESYKDILLNGIDCESIKQK